MIVIVRLIYELKLEFTYNNNKILAHILDDSCRFWNDAISASEFPTTCSRRVSIFSCVFFSCVGGAEVIV